MDLTEKEFLLVAISTTVKYMMRLKLKYYISKSQVSKHLLGVFQIVQNHAKYLKKEAIYI